MPKRLLEKIFIIDKDYIKSLNGELENSLLLPKEEQKKVCEDTILKKC